MIKLVVSVYVQRVLIHIEIGRVGIHDRTVNTKASLR